MALPNDHYTHTVQDAAEYESWRSQEYQEETNYDWNTSGDDWECGCGLSWSADYHYCPECGEDREDGLPDRCGCSDPCCPCDGIKRGVL
jgi:hypothetical protein